MLYWLRFFYLFLFVKGSAVGIMDDLVVDTKTGKVCGSKQKSFEGLDYYSFKGIPYAKPPVGSLRFQDTQPAEPWSGVRDATSHGPKCAQAGFGSSKIVGGDDCLYLNVYTRSTKSDKKLPVMVWIYGGAFITGSGDDDWYAPDYFMDRDVVLVTFNYRLGVLGFLNLESKEAPGNQGLKDQVMALKWVQENIASFGGDSSNVTIFGQSAGSVSVHYLVLSPLSKDLFHKAIMQSGSILCPGGRLTKDPSKYAFKLCQILGLPGNSSKAQIVEFLKTVDSHKLIEAQGKVTTLEEKVQGIFPFGPGIDLDSENPFMARDPADAALIGFDKPLMIGYTNREGILHGEHTRKRINPEEMVAKNNFEKYVHPNLKSVIISEYGSIENFRVEQFEGKDNLFERIVDFISSSYYEKPIRQVIKLQYPRNKTFFYEYTYDKKLSPIKKLLGSKLKGACHIDEVPHIFRMRVFDPPGTNLTPETEEPDYRNMRKQMIETWTNFAAFGTPTLPGSKYQWSPVADETMKNCMIINETSWSTAV